MQQFHGSDEYIASDELIRSVNIAAALKKPLLIKGEPGTRRSLRVRYGTASLRQPVWCGRR